MLKRIMFAVITMLLTFSLAGAEMYQWIAQDGSVTFKDTPPPASKKRKKVKVYDDSGFASAPPQQSAPKSRTAKTTAQTKERFNGTIEMYVTEWCPVCKSAENYFKKMNYPYVKYDIEKDNSANKRAADYPGRGVPLIIVGKNQMRGFSSDMIDKYMGY